MRLEVTRRTDLAVRSLVALSQAPGRLKAPEIAEQTGATPAFVPQVVAPLVAAGWVRSDPGPTGGYAMAVALDSLSLLDVIEAVEGPTDSGRCVLIDGACDASDPCSLHMAWQRARVLLLSELASTSLNSVEPKVLR